jgi:hypothetical protein
MRLTSLRQGFTSQSGALVRPIVSGVLCNKRTIYTSVQNVKRDLDALSQEVKNVVLSNKIIITNFHDAKRIEQALNAVYLRGVDPINTSVIVSACVFQGTDKLKEAEKIINSNKFDSILVLRGSGKNAFSPATNSSLEELYKLVNCSQNTLAVPLHQYERPDNFKRQLEAKLNLGAEKGFLQPMTTAMLSNLEMKLNMTHAQAIFSTLNYGLLSQEILYKAENIDDDRVHQDDFGTYHDSYPGNMDPNTMLKYIQSITADRPQDDVQTRIFMSQDDLILRVLKGTCFDKKLPRVLSTDGQFKEITDK